MTRRPKALVTAMAFAFVVTGEQVNAFPDQHGVGASSYSTPESSRIIARYAERQVLPHPSGCPSRAFCGCGAALDVFGKHVRELWLARNWFKFPRTSPAPGMVAVRRHHVFVIRDVRGNNTVLAYDANSGRGRTHLHVRSLAGYVVVDPRSRIAGLP